MKCIERRLLSTTLALYDTGTPRRDNGSRYHERYELVVPDCFWGAPRTMGCPSAGCDCRFCASRRLEVIKELARELKLL